MPNGSKGSRCYDVAVVGAGSAGCVLAARLSEDPSRRVLLLEAGPDYPTVAALPADIADGGTLAASHDWGYRAEPDAGGHALGLPRGRLVGGSSAVNACFALRGSPADYDRWAQAGNTGWSFQDVLPAFRSVERDLDFGDRPWHGHSGPLPIRRYAEEELTPIQRALLRAAVEAGHPLVEDHNAPAAVGAGRLPTNCVDGRRISSALAFLREARGRPNLDIRPEVLVDRVELRRGRAVAVHLAAPRERVEAAVIVLAAGAYGSAPILLRSGIGPAEELRRVGVEPVLDLPGVGRGLIDHPGASVDIAVPAGSPTRPVYQSVVTVHSSHADRGGPPDLQLFAAGSWAWAASPTGVAAALIASVVRPVSRGRVWLRSADPADPPRISPGHLGADADLRRMVEAMRELRRVASTPPLDALVEPGRVLSPGPEVWEDDTSLGAWLRATVWTYHHPVGTCRMGPDPGSGAVVDPGGRVHGLAGLAVADASVMPDIPSANTNLPTIMVAERLATALDRGA